MKHLSLAACAVLLALAGCGSPNAQLIQAIKSEEPADVLSAAQHGAKVNQPVPEEAYPTVHGKDLTPLEMACDLGRVEAVRALLQAGADPNARNPHGLAPLHYATAERNGGAVQLLLDGGADANAQFLPPTGPPTAAPLEGECLPGATPLILAVQQLSTRSVELLLQHGADPNHQDAAGQSAFWYAKGKVTPAQERRMSPELTTIRRLLLRAGANPDPRNNRGRTPFQQWRANRLGLDEQPPLTPERRRQRLEMIRQNEGNRPETELWP